MLGNALQNNFRTTVIPCNELSEQRAKAVINYLKKQGIFYKRLSYKGYGSSKPIANNNTDAGRKQNRRVEITVLEK